MRETERDRRAPHVLFHRQHAGRRLEIESAGIETHTLPDQCYARRLRRSPADIDKARRALGRASHRMHERIVLFEKRVTLDDNYGGSVSARKS